MDHFGKCTSVLRPLIAKGDANDIPLAEKAVNDLVAVTPPPQQKAALENVKTVVEEHRESVSGFQLGFADAINDYIEKLMREFE
jgi:hypothetical protein